MQVDGEKEGMLNIDHEFPKRGQQRWEQSLEHWILKSWFYQTELDSPCTALFFQSTESTLRPKKASRSLSVYPFSILGKRIQILLSRKEVFRLFFLKLWFSPAKELPN